MLLSNPIIFPTQLSNNQARMLETLVCLMFAIYPGHMMDGLLEYVIWAELVELFSCRTTILMQHAVTFNLIMWRTKHVTTPHNINNFVNSAQPFLSCPSAIFTFSIETW